MPTWGQLGCQGFIVLDGTHTAVARSTQSYLDVGDRAFIDVEDIVDELLDGPAVPHARAPASRAGCTECACSKTEEEGFAVNAAAVCPAVSRAPSTAPECAAAAAAGAEPIKREAFKGGISLGTCGNDKCLCAECECGVGCTCNLSEAAETCEPCTEFRAEKATT